MTGLSFSDQPVLMLGFVAFVALLVAAAAWDLCSYRIPNSIPVCLLGLYFLLAVTTSERIDWVDGLLGCLAVLIAGIPLFHWGIMGGGDIKLLAAVSAWIGLKSLGILLLLVALVGAWWAVALVVFRMTLTGRHLITGNGSPEDIPRLFRPGAPVPYAVSIALGAILAVVHVTSSWIGH